MDLQQILKNMVEGVSGGYAATVMGIDGITVNDYIKDGVSCDIEAMGVEYGKVIGDIGKAAERMNFGSARELAILMDGNKILLRLATPEYFVAFLVSEDEVLGKARFLLKKATREVRRELAQ